MPRPRKHAVKLPEHIHRHTNGKRVYYTFQRHRGTAKAGKRTPMRDASGPLDPSSAAFHALYERLLNEAPAKPRNDVAAMIRAYRASEKFAALSPNTRRDYERYLDDLERDFGDLLPDEVTSVVVQTIHDGFARTPVKARHYVSVIKALYRFGEPRGFCRGNPAQAVDLIRVSHDGAKPWPQWAFDAIEDQARWEVRMFVALGLYTGQRSSDIVKMRLSDIDMKAGLIDVVQQKTGKRRQIPLHRELRPHIRDAFARGSIVLVPGAESKPQSANAFDKMWRRELRKLEGEWEGIRLHGLRKSASVKLREAGCPVEEIMAITGNSRQMVEHYCRDYDQVMMARRAMERWEK